MGIASRILQETTKRGLAKKVLSATGKKLLRAKMFGSPGKWWDNFAYNRGKLLNPMKAGEDFLGKVLGVETRDIPMKKVIKTPGQAAVPEIMPRRVPFNTPNSYGARYVGGVPGKPAVQEVSEMVPKLERQYAERNVVGQLGSYLGLGTWGATLGGAIYGGKAGYDALKKDPNAPTAEGQAHPVVSEEEQKLRDTFAKKNLGGSDSFTPDMYRNMSKGTWVESAIKAIGMERYKKLREKGDGAMLHRTLVSAIHSDPEKLKQATSGDYVLPGIYNDDSGPNIQVVHLNKGPKGYNPKILNHMFTVPEAE